ncbi:MAG: Holliday junction branch migration protein RuvA [Clostridia bacterium]|nr:Holliday junction branch migration protein RuvA [Clostridia bacterium]MBQ2420706.1 Holliday junction branch migration protein RuvA [Clostridia bacterium]MBQ5902526.1 Holliday junction branch migration protein RuvA [Clostridia bacterium]
MFYSITGTLVYSDLSSVAIDCNGVAFRCNVSMNTLQHMPQRNSKVTVYTYLNVREDALDLFGFYSADELDMFKLITSVSGVGPKNALAILSEFEPDNLRIIIASGDAKSLTRASGVGTKLAQRIILELKDKVGSIGGNVEAEIASVGAVSASKNAAEAVEALVSLGYSQSEASLAVGRLDSQLSVEELIRLALKSMAKI